MTPNQNDWRVGDFAERVEDHFMVKAGEVHQVTEMFRGGYLGFARPIGGEWNPVGWRKVADPHLSRPSQSAEGQADADGAAEAWLRSEMGFDGPHDADTPLQAAARQAGWALCELVDGIDWAKRQQVQDIIGRLCVAVDAPDARIAKPQPLAKADGVTEAVERQQARMNGRAQRDWSYYVAGGEGDDIRTILADHARLKAREAALMEANPGNAMLGRIVAACAHHANAAVTREDREDRQATYRAASGMADAFDRRARTLTQGDSHGR